MSGKTNLCQSLVGGGCRAISPSMCPSDGVGRCRFTISCSLRRWPTCRWVIHITLQSRVNPTISLRCSITKAHKIKWSIIDLPASRWLFADGANLVRSCVVVRNGTHLISFWSLRGMGGDGTTNHPRHLSVRGGKKVSQMTHRDIVGYCILHKICHV